MPPSSVSSAVKKSLGLLQRIADLLQSNWVLHSGAFEENLGKLLKLLGELEDAQPAFKLVDANVPWATRAQRLMTWLRSHPEFECSALHLSDAAPPRCAPSDPLAAGSAPSRCAILDEAVTKGSTVLRVPLDAMMTTSTALDGDDMGALLANPRVNLRDIPTVTLIFHLMAEHARCSAVPLPEGSTGAEVPLPMAAHAAAAAAACSDPHDDSHSHAHGSHGHGHGGGGSHGHSHADGEACSGHHAPAPAPAPAAAATHGHSHGGGHGHSHGGVPCHGHGGEESGKELTPVTLDVSRHPWGSPFRAYLSVLPDSPSCCLYFTLNDFMCLKGTHAFLDAVNQLLNAARAYVNLYPLFGAGKQQILRGFEHAYTWAHFKWAMGVCMSRQNRVPARDNMEGAAGQGFDLALVPLYDMINHADGPIESYFFGATSMMSLDAMRDFAPGEELLMSYGGRINSQLLNYQGFCIRDNRNDTVLVEAAMNGLRTDPLLRIRMNVLTALTVTPEHHCQRHLRTPEFLRLETAARNAGTKEASTALELYKWAAPFSFIVRSNGVPSHDLLSFARVGRITTKAEAAEALKQCDQSRKSVLQAREEVQRRKNELHVRRIARRQKRELSAPGGDAAVDADTEAEIATEEAELEALDSAELPPLAIGVLSADNERAARTMVLNTLLYALINIQTHGAMIDSAPGSDLASEVVDGAADSSRADPVLAAARPSVRMYVEEQVSILQRAVALARAELASLPAAAEATV